MTHAKVLASIQGKYFLQYLPPIKSGSNTKNLIRSLMFPHTRRVSTMPLISNETIQNKHQKALPWLSDILRAHYHTSHNDTCWGVGCCKGKGLPTISTFNKKWFKHKKPLQIISFTMIIDTHRKVSCTHKRDKNISLQMVTSRSCEGGDTIWTNRKQSSWCTTLNKINPINYISIIFWNFKKEIVCLHISIHETSPWNFHGKISIESSLYL